MSFGLLFPGQGTQHREMLPWLEDDDAVRRLAYPRGIPADPLHGGAALHEMACVLGTDWRARLAEAGWADSNAVAQPLLVGVAIAAWEALRGELPRPAAVAGYSVGELAAFAVAGVFDAATALRLAVSRAAAMDACARAEPGGLLAVSDFAVAASAAVADRHGLALAIRLGDRQCILGGALAKLDAAEAALAAAGARCKRLAIHVASHTPLMAEASIVLGEALAATPFARPDAMVICNADARGARDPAVLRQALAAQVSRPIAWDACMDTLAERGPRCVLELGPGTTLAKLWNARHPAIPARAIDEFRSSAAAVAWVRGLA